MQEASLDENLLHLANLGLAEIDRDSADEPLEEWLNRARGPARTTSTTL